MCGIVGYIGDREVVPVLLKGLKTLEYRGYDSAGFCVARPGRGKAKTGALTVVKRKGKVSELEKSSLTNSHELVSATVGIAHTRWATHGEPNEKNAHPHLDCTGQIAIVHNGIVENYAALKELLKKEGHKIISDTDSEIIAHLVEKFYQGNLEKAVMSALALVEGAHGFLVMHAKEEKLVAAKKSSPLVIGIGKGEMFLASDAGAILSYTKKMIYLDDGEVATISKNNYTVKNAKGKKVDKKIEQIKWSVTQMEKGGYKHFMLKEIFEQPKALQQTLAGRIRNGRPLLSINLDAKKVGRVIITACGTSWHSALIGKYLIEKIAGISTEVDYASEFRYRDPLITKGDVVVAISQSGETADTRAALEIAKAKGAKTLGIVNVVGSTIARMVDSGIYLHAGPEIGVASTKAFVCQVASLTLLAVHLSQKPNPKLLAELQAIPAKIQKVLEQSLQIREIAKAFKSSRNFLYLGRNLNFPVALEGALKLKEISYIHAEGYPAAEMKHGPIALIDKNMPVVFVAPSDGSYEKIISNMQEIKARQGQIITVTDTNDPKISQLSEYIIRVPKTVEELSPLLNVIPLQLLAYHIADLKRLNVDRPRNLAKSVTVE